MFGPIQRILELKEIIYVTEWIYFFASFNISCKVFKTGLIDPSYGANYANPP